MNKKVESKLRQTCRLCDPCVQIMFAGYRTNVTITDKDEQDTKSDNYLACPLCLGLLSEYDEKYEAQIATEVKEKMNPYVSHNKSKGDETTTLFHATINSISKDSPTIVLPNTILVVAHCINCIIEQMIINQHDEKCHDENTNSQVKYITKNPIDVYNQIKEQLRTKIKHLINKINDEYNDLVVNSHEQSIENDNQENVSTFLQEEEAGYLKFHIVLTSPLTFPLLPFCENGIILLPSLSRKRDRKRFRGNDPVAKQGGDPRSNLNSFVRVQLSSMRENFDSLETTEGVHKSTIEGNLQCLLQEKNIIVRHLDTMGSRHEIKKQLAEWFLESVPLAHQRFASTLQNHAVSNIGVFVSCWRNHFYLKGKYTKSRRDVSQTPFFVCNDDVNSEAESSETQNSHEKMKKLGTTSVEEEICPIISQACNGIATKNNELQKNDSENKKRNILVYGICKFHASGREDMDVRMILPPEAKKDLLGDKKSVASGRPFICEVIDAYKFPSIDDLCKAVQIINQNGNGGCYDESTALEDIKLVSDGKWVNENERIHVQYGLNPRGVGVSGLVYCRSSLFGSLQAETEDKVKFYSCLCWSQKAIPSQKYLEDKLINGSSDGKSIYPLRIEQLTPLRVLHRRSADSRARHVLSLNAKRIDNHWFRLHLSTSAGTYVKEFCHGDCGRTKPSISSLLECKTDIVELDCEGIAVS